MNTKKYNKLVRDNVPLIIEKSGATPQYRLLHESIRRTALVDKLQEEIKELINTGTPEELLEEATDVYEVILALVYANGFIDADLEQKIRQKRRERGSFDKLVWLEKIIEQ